MHYYISHLEYNNSMTEIIVTQNSGFQIDVAFRNFLFMRGQAIKDTRDVMTELITNAVDAYRNIDGYASMIKNIYLIFYCYDNPITGSTEYYVSVTDNAIGVAPGDMKHCFMSAGSLTASDTSRGFFSTGAKNITIMGDVYYTSIKSGTLSQIYLDDQAYGHIVTSGPLSDDLSVVPDVVGIPATPVLNQMVGIPVNGLSCVLAYTNATEIAKFTSLDAIDTLMHSVAKIAVLRDIMSDPTYNIMFDIRSCSPMLDVMNPSKYVPPIITTDPSTYDPSQPSDNFGGKYLCRLQYTYPQGNMLLNLTFNVPDYPQYQAKFVVYEASVPISQPISDSMLEFGFLIKDSFAIYEVNTLGINDRYRWNPNMNYLYGYLYCDGFHQELLNYDAGTSSDLIIDPNRVGGINKSHPLYVNVLTVVLPRLDQIMTDVQNQTNYKSINIDELDTIVNKLQEMGVNIFNDNNITFNFTPNTAGTIAMAIQGTQGSVTQEITGSNNLTIMKEDSPIIKQIQLIDAQNNTNITYIYYVHPDTGDIQKIPINPPDPVLSPIGQDEQVIKSIIDGLLNQGIVTPLVYRVVNGDVQPMQIYIQGTMARPSPTDSQNPIQIQHKSLTIQFINDINYLQKYLIDATNGITIKINLHNPVVADKLSKTSIDTASDYEFSISNEASYDALNFLEILISSAFTDIVVGNDISSGKIASSTSDSSANIANSILDYWNKTEVQIEGVIHDLFTGFINAKKAQIQQGITQNINNAKLQIMHLVTSGNATMDEIEQGANLLATSLQNSVMGIVASN